MEGRQSHQGDGDDTWEAGSVSESDLLHVDVELFVAVDLLLELVQGGGHLWDAVLAELFDLLRSDLVAVPDGTPPARSAPAAHSWTLTWPSHSLR